MLSNLYTFLQGTVSDFCTTGAIAPSSPALAKAITTVVAQREKPAYILEVGAGTGVFTKKLVEILRAEDKLDVCEINPNFMKYIQEMAERSPSFKKFPGTIRYLLCPVQQIEGIEKYDFIVSSLPLNAFTPQLVSEILEVLLRLVKPQGWISYFEYIGVRVPKKLLAGRKERERIDGVTKLVTDFIRRYEVYHIPVLCNLPPAYARHCQKR